MLLAVYEYICVWGKDLGRWARRNLGLTGRTEPGVFTRIIWQDQVLGMHQPLALLLEDAHPARKEAMKMCTFCHTLLRESGTSGPFMDRRGPFYCCYHCGDQPSWHHGWCCPQNGWSHSYRGPTHADRTRDLMCDRLQMTQVD